MNDKCFFYKENECGPFTKPRIPIDGLFSKSDLDNNVEHHLSTIKIGKKAASSKSTNWRRAYKVKKFQDGDKIWEKHRYKIGIY